MPNGGLERYAYPIGLPQGSQMSVAADGSITIAPSTGEPLGAFAPPWVKDSEGSSVPTHYEIDGSTLVQIVNTAGTIGSVTADPHLD